MIKRYMCWLLFGLAACSSHEMCAMDLGYGHTITNVQNPCVLVAGAAVLCNLSLLMCKEVGCCRSVTETCEECGEKTAEGVTRICVFLLNHAPGRAVAMGDEHEHGR